jgi:hypothetical protein
MGLSIATKYTSILVAPIAIVYWARAGGRGPGRDPSDRGGWRRGLGLLVVSTAITLSTVVALYLPWVRGLDTFGPVLYWVSGPRLNNFAAEQMLITLASWTARWFGSYEAAWDAILPAFKLGAKGALAVMIALEAFRARTMEDVIAASARVCLAFLLVVNTWVMPWYYAWPLALCAALGWHSLLVRVCAGFTLTALVLMYQRQFSHSVVDEWGGLFLVLPLAVAALPALWRLPLRRRGEPSAALVDHHRTGGGSATLGIVDRIH